MFPEYLLRSSLLPRPLNVLRKISLTLPLPPIGTDGNPLHMPSMGQVVTNGIVLGNAVVPDGYGVVTPPETHLKFGFANLLEQILEHFIAGALVQVNDVSGEGLVDVEVLQA